MRRLLWALVALFMLAGVTATTGCNKPTEDECRAAIDNVRRLTGMAAADYGPDPEKAVRSCRGTSNRDSVRCVGAAASLDALKQCEGDMAEQLFGDGEE